MKMNQKNTSCEMISDKTRMVNRFLHVTLSLMIVSSFNLFAASADSAKHWVGTWACAPYKVYEAKNQPSQPLTGNTLRQIVRVSIGGDTLRVKFSNITCAKAISIKSVTIARSPDGTKCPVDASTIKQLQFKGDSTVTIDAKSEVYSDPVAFNLTPSMRLAITIYYGDCQSSTDMTFHYGSRGNSYWASGNKTTLPDIGNTTIPMWFTICSVDVLAPKIACSVAIIGNSITDGASLTDGQQNRWTDRFSESLLANPATAQVGVLNQGIGATNVLSASNGADAGITRFKHDILGQAGLHWVIIFYGVNDINGGKSASAIYNGIKQMADEAHAKDTSIIVYGATITPNSGKLESVRSEINNMIRTSKDLDGFIDLAKVLEDPSNHTTMLKEYEGSWNDGLHPGPKGHEAMGKSIDLKMFIPPQVNAIENTVPSQVPRTQLIVRNGIVEFELPQSSFVSLKVYSLLGNEIAELAGRNFNQGKHSIAIKDRELTNGTYIYSLKTDKFSTARTMVFPSN